ncbi:unnamed protein product [Gongylonema pulchrum]|uniref:Exportin-7/Ran-binding protein 17 TPR repeats domain-containing protein n=1 Tax=Gongylonema pulchrum TaxID=637853 RepID=A0A3P6R1E7_9BILA|nr:unnamed protein product [Gongylonema pulchrum]
MCVQVQFNGRIDCFCVLNTSNTFQAVEARESTACLAWLVTIIGAAVQGRAACVGRDDHDLIDGDMICRVLKLMELSDSRLATGTARNLQLETAFLYMLDQFRRIYVSDQIQITSKVYERMEKNLGVGDEASVLSVYVRKMITNLKYWASEEKLISDTLTLLNELSLGYSAARRLIRLPEIQLLLNHHTASLRNNHCTIIVHKRANSFPVIAVAVVFRIRMKDFFLNKFTCALH